MGRRVGRPLQVEWREDAAALFALYRGEPDGPVRTRLHALWLVRGGRALRDAARLVGAHERTVQQWLAWYRAGGVAAVRARRKAGKGRPARLTADQRARLLAHLAEGACFAARDAVAWVAATFGVRYRPKGMYSLLGRLRAKKKVPRPVNPKADPARQEAWKGGASRPP